MAALGRFMQQAGLVILPVAVLSELTGLLGRDRGVADMLLLLGFGFALFSIGRIFEGYATNAGKLGK